MVSLKPFHRVSLVVFSTLVTIVPALVIARGQSPADGPLIAARDALRVDFEADDTGWVAEGGDVNRRIRSHDRTTESSHSGRQAERIALTTGSGSHLYYSYPIGRALVANDLKISVWIKADRPGAQILARVVFPRERDPDTLQLLATLVTGSTYHSPGQWQQLDLERPDLATERQARLLRASLNRDVDTREAYVDRVMLNVYAGPGETTVLVDDLEVSPVLPDGMRLSSAVLGQPGEAAGPQIEVARDQLLVDGRPRLLRVARAPGVPPGLLKDFGFNVTAVEWPLDMEAIEQSVTSLLWLMPQLPESATRPSANGPPLAQLIGELPFRESVLCWNVGNNLRGDAFGPVAAAARELRATSPRRPIAADVTGNFWSYSREFEMLGAHRSPIGTAMELRQYRDWLTQRRYLGRPGTYYFTWIQTAADRDRGHVEDDTGPAPDQLRLLTYSALAAGCRGLGFWADRTLGQPGVGRERLLELGLLNLELQLLEPYFAAGGSADTFAVETMEHLVKRGPGAELPAGRMDMGKRRGTTGSFAAMPKAKTPQPLANREEVQATVLRSDRGLVVVPIWYGKGAQFVPGQMATNDLNIVIPGVPDAAQAWLVTPADVRMLKRDRVAGGMRLTVPEFDLTSIVILTSDKALIDQLRLELKRSRPPAALWAIELASMQLARVRRVNDQLAALGHVQQDGFALVQSAAERLVASRGALDRDDFAASYQESLRALRALRILQRAHWEDAVKGLSVPQSSPHATSFAGLPKHWQLMSAVQAGQFGPNLISAGDFESAEALAADGWTQALDGGKGLELKATLSSQDPHRGNRSLHLQVKPAGDAALPASLDPTVAALASRPIPVRAGDVLRIRFWLRVPAAIQGSIDGAVVYDSLGGPSLAVAQAEPLEWKQFTLYRRATRSDNFSVTLGITGIGDMYIDDLVVEKLVAGPIVQQQPAGAARR